MECPICLEIKTNSSRLVCCLKEVCLTCQEDIKNETKLNPNYLCLLCPKPETNETIQQNLIEQKQWTKDELMLHLKDTFSLIDNVKGVLKRLPKEKNVKEELQTLAVLFDFQRNKLKDTMDIYLKECEKTFEVTKYHLQYTLHELNLKKRKIEELDELSERIGWTSYVHSKHADIPDVSTEFEHPTVSFYTKSARLVCKIDNNLNKRDFELIDHENLFVKALRLEPFIFKFEASCTSFNEKIKMALMDNNDNIVVLKYNDLDKNFFIQKFRIFPKIEPFAISEKLASVSKFNEIKSCYYTVFDGLFLSFKRTKKIQTADYTCNFILKNSNFTTFAANETHLCATHNGDAFTISYNGTSVKLHNNYKSNSLVVFSTCNQPISLLGSIQKITSNNRKHILLWIKTEKITSLCALDIISKKATLLLKDVSPDSIYLLSPSTDYLLQIDNKDFICLKRLENLRLKHVPKIKFARPVGMSQSKVTQAHFGKNDVLLINTEEELVVFNF